MGSLSIVHGQKQINKQKLTKFEFPDGGLDGTEYSQYQGRPVSFSFRVSYFTSLPDRFR